MNLDILWESPICKWNIVACDVNQTISLSLTFTNFSWAVLPWHGLTPVISMQKGECFDTMKEISFMYLNVYLLFHVIVDDILYMRRHIAVQAVWKKKTGFSLTKRELQSLLSYRNNTLHQRQLHCCISLSTSYLHHVKSECRGKLGTHHSLIVVTMW